MFKIQWDDETGGVKLDSLVTKDTLSIAPRPVFYEELNLLGLNLLAGNILNARSHYCGLAIRSIFIVERKSLR